MLNRIFFALAALMLMLFADFETASAAARVKKAPSTCQAVPSSPLGRWQLSDLEWVADPSLICGGYFKSRQMSFVPNFVLDNADYVSIKPSGLQAKGHIKARKGYQRFYADKIRIKNKDKRIEQVHLIGHVSVYEPAQHIKAKRVDYFPETGFGEMADALYVLKYQSHSAWGRACLARRLGPGKLHFKQVSYSTCSPKNISWQIKARDIRLDKKTSKGVARDARLYIGSIPALYLPYFSFPLDNDRKSGFLMPKISYNTQNGGIYQIPYYLNLAPNYDATLLPQYFAKRGLMLGGNFRYLFGDTLGTLSLAYLHDDRAFKEFKAQNEARLPSLADLSDNRYAIKWHSRSTWENGVYLAINYQKVSDDYYLQDFQNNLALTSNQLPQEFELGYQNLNWTLSALYGSYQTLSPFNESQLISVYTRSPKLRAYGEYLNLPFNGEFNTLIDLEHLDWRGGNQDMTPEGIRAHLRPEFSLRKQSEYATFKPIFAAPTTFYELNHYYGGKGSRSIFIPQSALEVRQTLFKSINLHLTQTIEPELYYLYVPYKDQSDIPIFDSGYLQSTYNQLFRMNRFGGNDRVGDANHLSFGLTSRFLYDGNEAFRLSLGSTYRFERERVNLCFDGSPTPCNDNAERLNYVSPDKGLAPVLLEGETQLLWHTDILSNIAWNTQNRQINNALVNVHYEPSVNHILNLSYGFVRNGDPVDLQTGVFNNTNLHQIRLSYAWPINIRWHVLGAYVYNFSQHFSPAYFAGLEYDSCCMALRFIGGRAYRNFMTNGEPQYSQNVSLQLVLKGLGNVGSNDPGQLIHQYLPTYMDQYGQGVRL